MKNQKNVQAPRQGYEELYQLGYQTAALMVTDLDRFMEFGVSQNDVDELKQLVNAFGNRDFDEEYLLAQKFSTQEKQQLLSAILVILYKLEIKLSKAFSSETSVTQAFDLSTIRQLTEVEVAKKAKLSASLCNGRYASLLAPHISQAEIAELNEKGDLLMETIIKQQTSEKERMIATQIRASLACELFNSVRTIRRVGKKMWALTDVVKSNAYLMPKFRTAKSNNPDFINDNDEPDSDENS